MAVDFLLVMIPRLPCAAASFAKRSDESRKPFDMKHFDTTRHRGFFKVLASTRDFQAATMVLKPGQSTTDEPENEHAKCEQWLYVVSGTGRAIVGKRRRN